MKLNARLSCLAVLMLAAVSSILLARADEPAPALTIEPAEAKLEGNLARLQLAVTGPLVPDRRGDVTRSARYESLTPEIVAVDANGFVRPLANGEGRIRMTLDALSAESAVQVSGLDPGTGGASGTVPLATPSFKHDVIPILSRAGCNAGACHAAQYGQGGFKLSLFGFAPEQDYPALARESSQRRISLVAPADSLILQKATLATAHGGGKRFASGSYDDQVLTAWLTAGAPGPKNGEAELVDLVVSPGERVYRSGDVQQLRVVAKYSDGTQRDVTARAKYDSLNDAVAAISPSGYVTAAGSGQAAIMVRYLAQAKVTLVVVPYSEQVDLAGFEPRNFVDTLVLERWRKLGISPSPLCSDVEFIRRAFLDALGTLPKPERVAAFLASTEANKRESLIDELLGLTGDPARDVYVSEWSAYWALKWGDLIRNNRNTLGDGGMWALHNWLRGSLRENKPVDQFVRELITAQGSVFESGPANYYKIATNPTDLAEATAQNFLGVRLACAKCHNHPFEVYTQSDYYALAAFFTRVANKGSSDFGSLGGDTVVTLKRTGGINHPRTGQAMQPAPLLGKPIDQAAHRDLRRPLAEWLTSPDNRLFARSIVNRFWGYYMGTGLVEPIDDLRATNPASNPELLDALADDLVKNKFDLRRLMRTIMTSRVYQLSSRPTPANAADTRFYTHYNVKRLPAEVLLDAVDFTCGTREKFNGIPAGTRAIELPDPNFASYFLDTLGRPQRVITCECERTAEPNLAQVLHMANGDVLNRKLTDKNGRLANLVVAERSDDEIALELYLHAYSRRPTEDELAQAREIVSQATSRQEGLEDVLWAVLNSREFLFNH